MKAWLILLAVLQSLWSIEAGLLSFRYIVGFSLFWSFVTCIVLGAVELTLYYFLAEQFRRFLNRFSYYRNLAEKTRAKNEPWIKWCYRYRHLGLFLIAFIPHLLLVGIAVQKVLQFRGGYFPLLLGSTAKVAAIAYGLQIIECLFR